MNSNSSSDISPLQPAPADLARAKAYLAETRDVLIDSVSSLQTSQWEFKPSSGGWSIGEIVEHIVLVEWRLHAIIRRMPEAPAPPPDWSQAKVDGEVVVSVLNRSHKVSAPEPVHPSQHWTVPEAIERFTSARETTTALLSAPALRGHVLPHPVAGFWDGYQWLLAVGAHGARHTEQIREVKAESGFPETR